MATSVYATGSSIQRTGSAAPYRSTYTPQTAATPSRPTITDDYERWYTESTPNNRMLLSLRSGIDTEISWALDRLCRLCNNEQFLLRAIPGLADALFEWPVWYVEVGAKQCAAMARLFALPTEYERRRRHALESIFILRNAAMNEPNAQMLTNHTSTRAVILFALHNIRTDCDTNVEFMLYIIELMQAISPGLMLPPPDSPPLAIPVQPLQNVIQESSNRSLILASMTTLYILMSHPANACYLQEDAPALEAAVKYLPLMVDKDLLDASLNYLYAHFSYPPMSKAFLLHPKMPGTLRLLVSLLISEQVEEIHSIDIGGPVHTVPAETTAERNHELTKEELDRLLPLPEPTRCFEWMKAMFVAKADGELTQVDFWNLYKDVFAPHQERYQLLVASDVIKNVNVVFPQAQAMVLPGPPQRFVVRGVDRRKDTSANERFKCRWNRSQCEFPPFNNASELYEHVLNEHINAADSDRVECIWATCQHSASRVHIRGHVLTHLPSTQPTPRDPSQSELITLPSPDYPHPVPDPTVRPVPPLRSAKITYKRPVVDPPNTSLTALLCIRVLFRASFASSDAAPRADEDHFGFPGIVEESEDHEGAVARSAGNDREREGERRGRKAFIGVRHLMEGVRIRDEALMGWITEMVDAGIDGTT
ncbi:uncharacterized protein LAESUDRAFT_706126 [Laetiporus sulphureus 93-53]|uniref:RFX-type winged-helix domain-containing protein n=1 Tax=Laetiporus sulphureus 93-53 TaxID=1314785 RepID=A0A165C9M7_9APHY|nr:uncharacterized protein LAESUDRAFT_706126 [Laetiporus sulphureus 93-53]KZT02438.1 hypothetical protein LAESUDRAFT_706126 [Laetiporus sulphureus 93-53]